MTLFFVLLFAAGGSFGCVFLFPAPAAHSEIIVIARAFFIFLRRNITAIPAILIVTVAVVILVAVIVIIESGIIIGRGVVPAASRTASGRPVAVGICLLTGFGIMLCLHDPLIVI